MYGRLICQYESRTGVALHIALLCSTGSTREIQKNPLSRDGETGDLEKSPLKVFLSRSHAVSSSTSLTCSLSFLMKQVSAPRCVDESRSFGFSFMSGVVTGLKML